MFYSLNNYVFIKNINNNLVLIDKRNDDKVIGDFNSFVFLKCLSYIPQSIDIIAEKIGRNFSPKPDIDSIKNDFSFLVSSLVQNDLISEGESEEECIKNSKKFLYQDSQKQNLFSNSNEKELEQFQTNCSKLPSFQSLMIEITKKCNERCLHCYIPHEDKNIYMADKDFYEIIKQCKEIGTIYDIKISGGECMTHPSFKKFIKFVKDEGFALTVLSNLTLLDDEILQIMKQGTLTNVQVTLFSLDSKIHDKITTIPGSLEKALANLQKLHDANIPVSIATQVMELNKDSMGDLFAYASKMGFRMLCDWTIIAKENLSQDNLSLRVKDLNIYKDILNLKLKYDKNYKNEMKQILNYPLKDGNCYLCNAGFLGLQVETNLNVHACPGWNIALGNLRKNTLKEIWESSNLLNKIRNTRLAEFHKCVSCKNRNICHICMAQAYNENGKFEMPEYVCKMYDVIKESAEEIYH